MVTKRFWMKIPIRMKKKYWMINKQKTKTKDKMININHKILFYQKKFKSEVIDSFIDSYAAGETPIPCVQCNQTVKFRDLFEVSKEPLPALTTTISALGAKPVYLPFDAAPFPAAVPVTCVP